MISKIGASATLAAVMATNSSTEVVGVRITMESQSQVSSESLGYSQTRTESNLFLQSASLPHSPSDKSVERDFEEFDPSNKFDPDPAVKLLTGKIWEEKASLENNIIHKKAMKLIQDHKSQPQNKSNKLAEDDLTLLSNRIKNWKTKQQLPQFLGVVRRVMVAEMWYKRILRRVNDRMNEYWKVDGQKIGDPTEWITDLDKAIKTEEKYFKYLEESTDFTRSAKTQRMLESLENLCYLHLGSASSPGRVETLYKPPMHPKISKYVKTMQSMFLRKSFGGMFERFFEEPFAVPNICKGEVSSHQLVNPYWLQAAQDLWNMHHRWACPLYQKDAQYYLEHNDFLVGKIPNVCTKGWNAHVFDWLNEGNVARVFPVARN